MKLPFSVMLIGVLQEVLSLRLALSVSEQTSSLAYLLIL